jgi:shikimate dehydrogenase
MSQAVNYRAELVGLFGNPISENPTIVMQEAAFKATGLHWRYQNFEVHSEHLADAIRGARAMNMKESQRGLWFP